MSRSLKIILSVLALVSIGFSLAIVFDWNPVQKIKTRLAPMPTPTPTPVAEESAPEDLIGYPELKEMPVEDKNALVRPVDRNTLNQPSLTTKTPRFYPFFLIQMNR